MRHDACALVIGIGVTPKIADNYWRANELSCVSHALSSHELQCQMSLQLQGWCWWRAHHKWLLLLTLCSQAFFLGTPWWSTPELEWIWFPHALEDWIMAKHQISAWPDMQQVCFPFKELFSEVDLVLSSVSRPWNYAGGLQMLCCSPHMLWESCQETFVTLL